MVCSIARLGGHIAPTGKPEINTTCCPAWMEVDVMIALSTLSNMDSKESANGTK
jgi:hypothetical protein